jgi:hypothetical protein
VTGGWRKLRNEELRISYSSSDIITMIAPRRARLSHNVARMCEMRNSYILQGTPEGKR